MLEMWRGKKNNGKKKRENWTDFSGMIEMDHKGIFMKLFPEKKGIERKQCAHSSMPRIIKKCMNHQPTTHNQQEPHLSCMERQLGSPQPPDFP